MANPNKAEVFAALKAADAAGDMEAAARLAEIYRSIPEVEAVDVPASEFPEADTTAGLVQDGDTFRPPTAIENAKKSGLFMAGSLARGFGDVGMLAKNTFQGDPLGLMDLLAPNKADDAANERITNFLPDLIGAPKPETAGERVLDAAVRGAVGGGLFAKASGTGRFLREALIGGTAGTGAQAAGEGTAGTPLQTPAMIAGGLAGGLGMAGLSELGPRPLRDTLAGTVSNDMIDPLRASGAAAREARNSGVSLNTLDPYTGPGNPLTDLQANLMQSGGADKVAENIRKQGPEIQKLGNETVAALPGDIVTKQTVANQIGRAATGVQGDLQKAATEAFDAELRAIKARQVAAAEGEAAATGAELDARRRDMATSAEGGGRMIEEDFTDRTRAAKDAERRDQLAAGREVSNSTGFNIDELGNYGTMLAARRVREGKDPRASYSAQDLLDAGLTSQEVRALVAGRQPVTQGTGVMVFKQPNNIGRDNPGGDWLARKQESARQAMQDPGEEGMAKVGLRGAITAYTKKPVELPVALLAKLKGANQENPVPGTPKYDRLAQSVKERGWNQPDDEEIMVGVNHLGEPYLMEGNNRVAVAAANGVERVKVSVQWRNGGEAVDGPLSPKIVTENSFSNPPVEPPGRVGQVGDEIIQRAQKDYLDAAEAHENALAKVAGIDQLPPSAIAEARSRINNMIADQRGNQQMVEDLVAIRDGFADLRTTKELQNYIVSIRHQLPSAKLNSRPADISEGSVLGAAIAPLKALRNQVTPAYAAADDAYKAAKAAIAKIHDETDIGKLTPRAGTYADGEASAGAVFKLLQDGESPNATDGRLRKTLLTIGQKDPAALSTAVKSYLDNLMGEVFGKEATGRPSVKPGTKLTAALGSAGEPANAVRMNALRIAIDTVADVNKLPISERQAMHRGLDHLREIANANARTPDRPTSLNARELAEVAGELRGLAALRLLSLNAGNQFYRWLKLRTQAKTFRQLDELFSNPSAENIETLIELGKTPKLSRRKAAILATLIGMSQTDSPPEEK